MHSLLILNGPNLNLLGTRQPEVYGAETLEMLENKCIQYAQKSGVQAQCLQSNHEGVLLDAIHDARGKHAGIVLNAGAYTHTSVALMDAIYSVEIPTVEVHLSNIHAREAFRHQSYIARAAIGQICGFGPQGYLMAIDALIQKLSQSSDIT